MSEYVVVPQVKGLSKVPAYVGNRVDGYQTVYLTVGTKVTNVSKFPYELKKFYGTIDGVVHVLWKDSIKRAPRVKKGEEE
ncbi:hypothetical protein [Xanthomonas phage BUDD]|nr:hypothetical protein [Xanthomonas phage BUDD]WEM34457.1 hypothetical protein [Xanthomonas phage X1]